MITGKNFLRFVHFSKKTNTAAKSEVKVSSSLKAGPKRPEGYGLPAEESQHKPMDAYEGETIEQVQFRQSLNDGLD